MGAVFSILSIIMTLPIIIPLGIFLGYTDFAKYAFYLLLVSLPIFIVSIYTDKGDADGPNDAWKPNAAFFSGTTIMLTIITLITRGAIRQNLNSTSLGLS